MLFTRSGDRAAPAGEELAHDPELEAEHEFKLEQAEITSEPAADAGAVDAQLCERRAALINSARERGVLVAALGTSPLGTRPTRTPDERYERMHERFGRIAGEQLTCGAHVHVSIESRAEGISAINGLRAWSAVLLALSANSPFWDGADTGYASYRSVVWGRWPTAGPTARFADERDYDRTVAQLVASGAAIDEGMIYFDARLSASYPTVEIRVADVGQTVADSVLLATLCRALVDTFAGAESPDPPVALLRAAAWRAARYGLSGELVDVVDGRLRPAADLFERLLEVVGAALVRSCDAGFVRDGIARLLRDGTGAQLQRTDLARRDRPADVVRAAAARTAPRSRPVRP